MTDAQETAWNSRILLGLAIVVIGLAMLVETNEDWGIHIHVGWWPFLLIFLGVAKMVLPGEGGGRRKSRRSGFWLLSVGAWGLISEAQLFGFDYGTSWPLLVIALGMNIVWRSMEGPSRRQIQEQ